MPPSIYHQLSILLILLHRLSSSFKLSSTVLKWFRSFLTERSQYIQFRETFSSVHSVSFGVPQGSVLGPILFILYISDIIDIAKKIDLNVHVFADDIQLYGACSPSQVNLLSSRMSACVAALDSWLKTNSLHLNALKTNLMWIGTRQRLDQIDRRPIPVGAHFIHPASSLRCHGFTIDSTLSLSPHVSKILSSCFGTLRQLRSVRRSITRPLAISLVTSLVFPKLEYCLSVLSGLPDCQSTRLQSVINAAARFVDKLSLSSHISSSLQNLQWPPVKSRIDLRLLLMAYKCLHGLAPAYLSELLIPVRHLPGRSNLRSSTANALEVPRLRLRTTSRKSFSAAAARAWNQLPPSISSADSLRLFKAAVIDFL